MKAYGVPRGHFGDRASNTFRRSARRSRSRVIDTKIARAKAKVALLADIRGL